MKTPITIALVSALLIGCATKPPANKRVGTNKEGPWKEILHTPDGDITSTGKYVHSEKVGKWKYYYGPTKYQIERYSGNKGVTKTYYTNGVLQSKVWSKTDITSTSRHWYIYAGKYYDENGKRIRKFDNSAEMIREPQMATGEKENQDNYKRTMEALNDAKKGK